MSDIRFNRWLHQSGTGGVSQDSSGNIGIGTTVPTMALDVRGNANVSDTFNATTGAFSGNISAVDGTFTGNVTIGGTLTYEDVANIDAVGIITAQSDVLIGRNLNVTGVSTGTKFNSTTSPNYVISDGTTEKGYIGYNANDPFIGRKNGVGLAFQNNKVRPVDGDDGSPSSNTVDLGEPTYKFKDAYLTGTVNSAGINATGVATATTFSGNLTIPDISSSISDTAVDVFVYDTRKDSDGGAWRKRTQHTSWYNETLNTATRGTRREFPSVAVIVATTSKVTIYDGDDPDLPMWMVFDGNSSDMFTNGGTNYAVTSLNGILSLGENGAIWNAHFISDRGDLRNSSRRYDYKGNIEQRNDGLGYTDQETSGALVNSKVNDVAMTVLPNAPIDSATGLPIPTIAVATDGGVSVIKDDGTVVDITSTKAVNDVELVHFDKTGRLYFAAQASSSITDVYHYSRYTIPSADITTNVYADNSDATYYPRDTSGASFQNERPNFNAQYNDGVNEDITHISSNDDGGIVGNVNGLSIFAEDYSSQGNGMVAYATTSYNTGWMHGDIKGAFLSDTDATNVTGSELVTNGGSGFSGTSGWYLDDTNKDTGTIATIAESSGSLVFTHSDTNNYWDGFGVSITTVVGESYTISADIAVSTDMNSIRITNTASQHDTSPYNPGGFNSAGLHSYTFIATATTTYIHWNGYASTATMTLDSFSVRLADPDRSVNNNGLQVFGTITKSAVATGAELVAYSGWSDSNYLEQPYNSDLDFGTGDFSVMGWFKPNTLGAYDTFISRGSAGGISFECSVNSSKYIRMSLNTSSVQSTTIPSDGVWSFYTAVRRSGVIYLYHNGVFLTSGAQTDSVTDTDAIMKFGNRHDVSGTNDFDGSLALWRVSGSIPSAEQIKKIYEDEKVLFQENAACTLYGSSDAVTALAYDDSTNLLYAGTSSGRSDFQGLRRINNTTTAVTTAMSASNGLVAEQ